MRVGCSRSTPGLPPWAEEGRALGTWAGVFRTSFWRRTHALSLSKTAPALHPWALQRFRNVVHESSRLGVTGVTGVPKKKPITREE